MLKYYDFSGVSFLVDKSFECENASENAAARFDLVHNPTVPYLTDSKFTPFSAPSRGRLYIHKSFFLPPAGGNFLMVFINRKISNFVKNDASLVPMIGVKGKSISRLRVCGFLIYTV